MEGNGPNLLGRDWLQHLRINWSEVSKVQSINKLNQLLEEYSDLFRDELGTVKNFKAHLKFILTVGNVDIQVVFEII